MTVTTTYTGADTAAGFKTAVVTEIKRRIERMRSEQHRDRTQGDKMKRAASTSELETLAAFIEAIDIKPE